MLKDIKENTKLRNFLVYYQNKKEFHTLKNEIFTQKIYDIDLDKPDPLIIDIGGHIGLSTLYFKDKFPNSQIVVFEPHPDNFEILEMNVFHNSLENVTCIQKAVTGHRGKRNLYFCPGHLSSASLKKGAWDKKEDAQEKICIEGITLNEFVNEQVDLMKIDAEGLEEEILLNSKEALSLVSNLIFEFHYSNRKSFDKIKGVLKSCGFCFEDIKKPILGQLYILKCYKN